MDGIHDVLAEQVEPAVVVGRPRLLVQGEGEHDVLVGIHVAVLVGSGDERVAAGHTDLQGTEMEAQLQVPPQDPAAQGQVGTRFSAGIVIVQERFGQTAVGHGTEIDPQVHLELNESFQQDIARGADPHAVR